jgi:hypothetical protein
MMDSFEQRIFRYRLALFTLTILLIIASISLIQVNKTNADIENGRSIVSNWACLDGCFYAECSEIQVITNETDVSDCSESFDNCSAKCSTKFLANLTKSENTSK